MMTPRARRILVLVLVAPAVYLGGYLAYRASHREVWARDGQTYVIFGSRLTYYLFRPASYLDAAVTGIGFHIGPH